MRADWNEYFIGIAQQVATRATCARKHVGCVLVRDRTIVSTGFNGAPRGLPHCDEHGHDLVESMSDDGKLLPNCVRVVHAEANAIAQAARNGIAVNGATCYITTFPCWPCFRLLINAGIIAVVYEGDYRNDKRVEAAAKALGITITKFEKKP